MKYMVCEVVKHYHEIEIDDELEVLDIVNQAETMMDLHDSGVESLIYLLEKYRDKFGFDFCIKADYCGKESVELSVVKEID